MKFFVPLLGLLSLDYPPFSHQTGFLEDATDTK